MSERPRRSAPNRRLAGAGVAGLAAVFAVTPFAHAAPAPSGTSTAPGGAAPNQADAKVTPKAAVGAKTPAVQIGPDFGFQKVRVGVQIKSGAYVPPGTTTGDTKISILETGPFAALAALINGDSCRTVVGSEPAGSSETFCDFGLQAQSLAAAKKALGASEAQMRKLAAVPETDYLVFPGDTVTFEQTTVNDNLLIDPVPQTVGPCLNPSATAEAAAAADPLPTCSSPSDPLDVTFNDAGLPPTAKNDTSTVTADTKNNQISVLDNDVTNGAPPSLNLASQPTHGTAKVSNSAVLYTPDAGFVGHDSFRYTLTTANGSSTATVSVTVIAPPPTANNDSASTIGGDPVTVSVTANDDANGGGALSLKSVGDPAHGSVTVDGLSVVYTPDANFVGTDTFIYTVATAFGTDTATVTIDVSAPLDLAATGAPDSGLLDISIMLLIAGGAATVVGRRRNHGRHA